MRDHRVAILLCRPVSFSPLVAFRLMRRNASVQRTSLQCVEGAEETEGPCRETAWLLSDH